jgi:hypothetical protein
MGRLGDKNDNGNIKPGCFPQRDEYFCLGDHYVSVRRRAGFSDWLFSFLHIAQCSA